jgi:hypothetical protein
MDWRCVDERLIRRDELLLRLDFLESYDLDLSLLNCGKVGRPYRVTCMYVVFLAVVKYLFSMPYRQLEGILDSFCRWDKSQMSHTHAFNPTQDRDTDHKPQEGLP